MRVGATCWHLGAIGVWLVFSACSDEAEPKADAAAGSGGHAKGGSSADGGDGSGEQPGGGESAGGSGDSNAGSAGDTAGGASTGEIGGQGGSLEVGAGTGGVADVVGGGGGAAGSSDAAAGAAGAAGSGLPNEDSDELCADGSDNDGDGDQDCEDDDCKMSWLTACSEVCDDALDNDGDGDQDCDDRACNGENGATASPNCNVRRLQELQDGTVAAGTQVTTFPVYVTAIRDTGARHLFLQEGNGVTISPHAYPEYAGIHVFATLGESDNLGLDGLAIGDCVQLTGTLTENANSTELVSPTAFEVLGSGCGDFPQPTVVALSAIASDTDLATQGSQTGGFVENYESVLVQVQNVRVSHLGASNAFDVVTLESDQQILTVDDFFYGAAPVVDQTYTTLTGVLDQFNALYRLLPRTAADVVP